MYSECSNYNIDVFSHSNDDQDKHHNLIIFNDNNNNLFLRFFYIYSNLAAQAHELGLPCVICELHFAKLTLCMYPFHVCKYYVISREG